MIVYNLDIFEIVIRMSDFESGEEYVLCKFIQTQREGLMIMHNCARWHSQGSGIRGGGEEHISIFLNAY